MLKKFGRTKDGRPLVLLGLSGENMTRLLADEPIVVRLPEAAIGMPGIPDCVVVLVGGRTEADIAAQVADSPTARLLVDHPPTPGRTTIVTAEETPLTDLNEDAVMACADLVGRAGAREFELAWTCPHTPNEPPGHNCPDVTWNATAHYQGARIQTAEHRSPSTAAMALAERLLRGATCRCRQPVTLSDGKPGCRWRLTGQTWEPGCDAPSVRVTGARGDHAAIVRALGEPANRRERRAQKRRTP